MVKGHGTQTSLAISFALQLGFFVVVALVGFLWIGLWLDAFFGTGPFFLFVGIICGLAEAAYTIFHALKPLVSTPSDTKTHDSD